MIRTIQAPPPFFPTLHSGRSGFVQNARGKFDVATYNSSAMSRKLNVSSPFLWVKGLTIPSPNKIDAVIVNIAGTAWNAGAECKIGIYTALETSTLPRPDKLLLAATVPLASYSANTTNIVALPSPVTIDGIGKALIVSKFRNVTAGSMYCTAYGHNGSYPGAANPFAWLNSTAGVTYSDPMADLGSYSSWEAIEEWAWDGSQSVWAPGACDWVFRCLKL